MQCKFCVFTCNIIFVKIIKPGGFSYLKIATLYFFLKRFYFYFLKFLKGVIYLFLERGEG